MLTAVHEKFQPSLIQTEQDNPDILIVQCEISNNYVRLINGYGPQENDPMNEKMNFFTSLETAVMDAISNGYLMCAELDANSKIGMENLKSDPNHISANGQLLMELVNRNGLIVVNSSSKCTGVITRLRRTKVSDEKSVIDYFIVCPKFFELIISMEVDESRKYVLTKYSSRMGVPCIVESDHNPLVCTLKIKWDNRIKIARKEVFKLKDTEGLIRFNEITSNCPKLIQISNNSPNFSEDAEKWMKKIQEIMHQSFKKVRITGKGRPQNTELDGLMKAKQDLRSKLGKAPPSVENRIKDNIDKIVEEISKICSDRNSKIVRDHISELSNEEGHVSDLIYGG